MAATETLQIPLGFPAPDFSLPDTVSGKTLSFQDIRGEKGTLVMFICNHCPYVIHVKEELARLAKAYQPQGIGFVAISSNDVENYPADAPDKMTLFAQENGFTFPYLYDKSQDTAKAYFAACTPDFSLFDAENRCVYRGQLDSSRPKNDHPVTGKDLREALDALLEGKEINALQIPSIGCNIKWKVNPYS
ncbi:MAG: thioredoxin family protein [Flavobacteriales bacterium]|nr:thioredoxin family protein [Flavobacteriales bacterium]